MLATHPNGFWVHCAKIPSLDDDGFSDDDDDDHHSSPLFEVCGVDSNEPNDIKPPKTLLKSSGPF